MSRVAISPGWVNNSVGVIWVGLGFRLVPFGLLGVEGGGAYG